MLFNGAVVRRRLIVLLVICVVTLPAVMAKGDCTGISFDCKYFDDVCSCDSQVGCNWDASTDKCKGGTQKCDKIGAAWDCYRQKGCEWEETKEAVGRGAIVIAVISGALFGALVAGVIIVYFFNRKISQLTENATKGYLLLPKDDVAQMREQQQQQMEHRNSGSLSNNFAAGAKKVVDAITNARASLNGHEDEEMVGEATPPPSTSGKDES